MKTDAPATLAELAAMDREMLTPADVAPLLDSSAQSVRSQAQVNAAALGFHVCIVKNRVYIPKLAFLRWMHYPVTEELLKKSAFRRLESYHKAVLYADDVGEVLGITPQNLRAQARTDPTALGFSVSCIHGSMRVGRIALMDWGGYYPENVQRRELYETAIVAAC